MLGVGVGTLEEEFQLLGAPFAGRGERADDALRALRAAWAAPTPEYAGTHYRFHDLVVDPHAVQPRPPIWVGGRTARSLRRACRLGDVWVPFGLPFTRIAELLRAADPPPGFEVVLQPTALDPLGDPAGTRAQVECALDAGATVINARFAQHSLDRLLDQMAALPELFPQAGWTPAAE
ncbi:LLM class flavin-dependent oxidoreductase [Micromonospora sp. NPDC050200]|uniref:LLM class flavin-dependent oxidoreductase n=1 Tax=Micromonospora sp. NPDC050200 TaxID=3155664 RepID=UPI0033DB897B